MGLVDCTVGMCGFYTDPVSPATLFGFFKGILAVCLHPLAHERGRAYRSLIVCNMLRIHKARLVVL
jgi:hypothetical protein